MDQDETAAKLSEWLEENGVECPKEILIAAQQVRSWMKQNRVAKLCGLMPAE